MAESSPSKKEPRTPKPPTTSSENQSPSPKRRVPVVVEPLPEDNAALSDPVAEELKATISQEAKLYKTTGSITPRKPRASEAVTEDNVEEKDSGNKEESGALVPADNGVVPEPPARRYFPKLRMLFECFGQSDAHPKQTPSLALFHNVVRRIDPTVRWDMESPIQKNVRIRVENQQREFEERTRRAKELMKEQAPKLSTHEAFMKEYEASQAERKLNETAEKNAIDDIDRRAERRVQKAERKVELKKEVGDERKAAAHKAMEERRLEREKRLLALKDLEEEERDNVDAVTRVRSKFEYEMKNGKEYQEPAGGAPSADA